MLVPARSRNLHADKAAVSTRMPFCTRGHSQPRAPRIGSQVRRPTLVRKQHIGGRTRATPLGG
eukprot:5269559-Pleurochrysis_carterae.AAC.1